MATLQGSLFEDVTKQCARCWDCLYCDKEYTLRNGSWHKTSKGYCMAEGSAANGADSFTEPVYLGAIQAHCDHFTIKQA